MKCCSWFGGKLKFGSWVLVACRLPVSILCHQAVNVELLFRYMTHGIRGVSRGWRGVWRAAVPPTQKIKIIIKILGAMILNVLCDLLFG